MIEDIPITRIELEQRKMVAQQYVDEWFRGETIFGTPEFHAEEDKMLGKILYQIKCFIFTRHIDKKTFKYPRDWWEAFKERWLRWIPRIRVKYTVVEIDIDAEYPSLNFYIKGHEPIIVLTVNTRDSG
jgi:hypothetical protein